MGLWNDFLGRLVFSAPGRRCVPLCRDLAEGVLGAESGAEARRNIAVACVSRTARDFNSSLCLVASQGAEMVRPYFCSPGIWDALWTSARGMHDYRRPAGISTELSDGRAARRTRYSVYNLPSACGQGNSRRLSRPTPHDACAIWFTDPPYYDAIPLCTTSPTSSTSGSNGRCPSSRFSAIRSTQITRFTPKGRRDRVPGRREPIDRGASRRI